MTSNHLTVFKKEAVAGLEVKKEAWYLDGTFGGGGHTREILNGGGKVLAFDFDEEATTRGKAEFAAEIASGQLILVKENFAHLGQVVKQLQHDGLISEISGMLFDFGTSTDQLMNEERGFSFTGEGELDMRMDQTLGVKAKDLLALLSQKQLAEVFSTYGGEQEADRIAGKIVRERKIGKFITTNQELARLIEKTKVLRGKTHPATKVFQALRIVVNGELDNIAECLPQALANLKAGGRLVTISFHEGEDRLVKQAFKKWQDEAIGTMITKKALQPSLQDMDENPRCRSAKLRIFEKNEKTNL